MVNANPKVASLPVMVLAVAAVQLGAAFLAVSVQQSTGARLDRFLDELVVLTVVWAIVVLFDLFAFPSAQMSHIVAGPALAVTAFVAVLIVIFRAVEGLMGHSQGLRYALGEFGYTSALVWAGASLGLLVAQRYKPTLVAKAFRERSASVQGSAAVAHPSEEQPVYEQVLDEQLLEERWADQQAPEKHSASSNGAEPPSAPPPLSAPRRSAFSAALEDPEPTS